MRRASPLVFLFALLCLGGCAPEGPSAFVTFNVAPDSECVWDVEGGGQVTHYPTGLYDVAPGPVDNRGDYVSRNCRAPYVVHLLVNSFLRPGADMMLGRAEPNILQLHSAEVLLMNIDRVPIGFDQDGVVLPNPFLVTTNNSLEPAIGASPSRAVAAVEVIPSDYADQLESFAGGQILAEVQIFGTTTGDVDIELKPFTYPIELCKGCLQRCAADLTEEQIDDLVGDECTDNSGSDGRFCLDFTCGEMDLL